MAGKTRIFTNSKIFTHRGRSMKRGSMDEAIFRSALEVWADWVRTWLVPKSPKVRAALPTDLLEVYENAFKLRVTTPGTHSNPTEAEAMRMERWGHDVGASINAIVLDYPREWRIAMVGLAFGLSQAGIGEYLGLRQQAVSVMVSLIRSRFVPQLKLNASCVQRLNRIHGTVCAPPLHSGLRSVVD